MTDATKTITAPVVEDRNAWRWGFTPQAEIWNVTLGVGALPHKQKFGTVA